VVKVPVHNKYRYPFLWKTSASNNINHNTGTSTPKVISSIIQNFTPTNHYTAPMTGKFCESGRIGEKIFISKCSTRMPRDFFKIKSGKDCAFPRANIIATHPPYFQRKERFSTTTNASATSHSKSINQPAKPNVRIFLE
jgi:hypothetical protein